MYVLSVLNAYVNISSVCITVNKDWKVCVCVKGRISANFGTTVCVPD